jgi:hypothetical protein
VRGTVCMAGNILEVTVYMEGTVCMEGTGCGWCSVYGGYWVRWDPCIWRVLCVRGTVYMEGNMFGGSVGMEGTGCMKGTGCGWHRVYGVLGVGVPYLRRVQCVWNVMRVCRVLGVVGTVCDGY